MEATAAHAWPSSGAHDGRSPAKERAREKWAAPSMGQSSPSLAACSRRCS